MTIRAVKDFYGLEENVVITDGYTFMTTDSRANFLIEQGLCVNAEEAVEEPKKRGRKPKAE